LASTLLLSQLLPSSFVLRLLGHILLKLACLHLLNLRIFLQLPFHRLTCHLVLLISPPTLALLLPHTLFGRPACNVHCVGFCLSHRLVCHRCRVQDFIDDIHMFIVPCVPHVAVTILIAMSFICVLGIELLLQPRFQILLLLR
jgi:hypothetical protein